MRQLVTYMATAFIWEIVFLCYLFGGLTWWVTVSSGAAFAVNLWCVIEHLLKVRIVNG